MQVNPSISVVMPVYNAAKYVHAAVESILRQSYGNFEFIIIEDASTDDTPLIVEKYSVEDPRIRIIKNERNSGVAASLNKGLDNARGEFIARMDADDISYPQRLRKQMDFLIKNPDICLVATSYERIDEEGNILAPIVLNLDTKTLKMLMRCDNYISHGSVMFRREPIIKLGKYREKCLHTEDHDLWLRIIEKYDIALMPEILYQFRITRQSVSSKYAMEMAYYKNLILKFAEERQKFGKDSYEKLVKEPISIEPTSEKQSLASLHLQRGLAFLSSNIKNQARIEFRECIKARPLHLWYWLLMLAAIMPTMILDIARWFWKKSPKNIS